MSSGGAEGDKESPHSLDSPIPAFFAPRSLSWARPKARSG